tara:strand:+ start:2683 stop:3774 length:1092 start_codon:yes stop_codon:yes gene_type:complete
MKTKRITFVFLSDRKKRLEAKNIYAKEFFYAYHHLSSIYKNVNIVEFNNSKDSTFDKLLRKLTDLPFFSSKIINKSNINLFLKTNVLILTNQRVGFSTLPLLMILKIIKRIKVNIFIMGLFDKKTNYRIKSFFRSIFIGVLIIFSNKLIFLSKGEYDYALNKMPFWKKKFIFIPFSVDVDFWKFKEKDNNKREVLFIGNDGQRDYEFVIKLAKSLNDFHFTFVTNRILPEEIQSDNVTLINGSWGNDNFSDEFIHQLYTSASITIIPIKESLQPSGQSVALQSMSSGTPVIITKTNGFWAPNDFKDDENILFVSTNEITEWKNRINSIINDKDLSKTISINAKNTISSKYTLKIFDKKISDLI